MRSFFTWLILSPTCARKVAGSTSNSSKRLQPSRIALIVPRVSPTASCSSAIRIRKVVFRLSRNGHHGGARALGAHARVVDAQRGTLARHLGRTHGEHAVDRLDGMLDEPVGVDLDLEARALADAVPQGLERGVKRDVLLQLDRDLLSLVAAGPSETCG